MLCQLVNKFTVQDTQSITDDHTVEVLMSNIFPVNDSVFLHEENHAHILSEQIYSCFPKGVQLSEDEFVLQNVCT